jgi:hypothetical protein
MLYRFYRPDRALEVSLNEERGVVTLRMARGGNQRYEWRNATRFALNPFEVAEALCLIRKKVEQASFIHTPRGDTSRQSEAKRLTLSWRTPTQQSQQGQQSQQSQQGELLVLTFSAGGDTFIIGMTPPEALIFGVILDESLRRLLWRQNRGGSRENRGAGVVSTSSRLETQDSVQAGQKES